MNIWACRKCHFYRKCEILKILRYLFLMPIHPFCFAWKFKHLTFHLYFWKSDVRVKNVGTLFCTRHSVWRYGWRCWIGEGKKIKGKWLMMTFSWLMPFVRMSPVKMTVGSNYSQISLGLMKKLLFLPCYSSRRQNFKNLPGILKFIILFCTT